jgi:putative ABC transport system permease protein
MRLPGISGLRFRSARRELRADAWLLGCLAAIVMISTLMVTAGPALIARQDDTALRTNLTSAANQGLGVTASMSAYAIDVRAPSTQAEVEGVGTPGAPRVFSSFVDKLLAPVSPWTRSMLGAPAIDVATPFVDAVAPGINTIGDVPPMLRVDYADPVAGGLHYVEGTPPPAGPLGDTAPAPIATSTATRDKLHLTLGEVITLGDPNGPVVVNSGPGSAPTRSLLKIVGFFEPVDTASSPAVAAFWFAHQWLRAPVASTGPAINGFPTLVQRADVLTSVPGMARVLPGITSSGPADAVFTFPLNPAALKADTAAALAQQLGRMTDPSFDSPCTSAAGGSSARVCGPFITTKLGVRIEADAKATLDRFVAARAEVWVVDSFSLAGLATVALITLFSAARLTVARRERDLALHRARGATVRGLMGAQAVRGAVVTVPALAAGWLGARLVLRAGSHPGQSSGGSAGWLVVAIGVAGFVLLPALTWARTRPRSAAVDRGVSRRRRLAIEAGLVLMAAGAVSSLHNRGIDSRSTAGVDPEISLVPALLGAVGAVVLLRLHPLVLGAALRWARRRRTAVPVLAFAQARRHAGLGAAGLLVLVLTLAGLVFGGLVTRTVTGAHADVVDSISGDAVVSGRGLNLSVRDAVAEVGGVQHVIAEDALWVTPEGPDSVQIKTIAVDAKALTASDPGSQLGRLLGGSDQVAYASASVPHSGASLTAHTASRSATFSLAGVGTLDAADLRVISAELGDLKPGDPFLVVPLTALPHLTSDISPDTLVVDGPAVTASGLRGALPTTVDYQILMRRDLGGDLDASSLTKSLTLVTTACAALASAFALLAVVLELLASARSRGEAVSFLRTMGLRSRAATSMLIVQLLPPALLAAAAGVGLGIAIPPVLGSALRLRAVTGGSSEPVVRVDFVTSAFLGAGVVALVLLAAVIDSRLARRRKLGAVLRLDSR